MDKSMMDLFAENDFGPLEIDGALVHPYLWLDVTTGDKIRISWVSVRSPRPQGVGVRLRRPAIKGAKGRGGRLVVEGVEAPVMTLWHDTAPPTVMVECAHVMKDAGLRVTNMWRIDDVEHEWLNNYGMVIDEVEPDVWELTCSDGYGELTLGDLVVRVEHIPGGD